MRDVLHAIATVLVIAIAAICTMAQIADVQHALDRLGHDESSVQQVDRGTGQDTNRDSGQGDGHSSVRPAGRR